MQKNMRNKRDQLTQFLAIEKTKPNPIKTKSKKLTNIFQLVITIKSADLKSPVKKK